ncbi:MAG: N-6 DNA methylase [Sandaracinaceae bacterium]|nr:N-6 DNA methylase [Sandaracinaceae bacterium]
MRRSRQARISVESISIQGNLFTPEHMNALLRSLDSKELRDSYPVPAGQGLAEWIALAWQSAQRHWEAFTSSQKASAQKTREFVEAILREVLGFENLGPGQGKITLFAFGHSVPILIVPSDHDLDTPLGDPNDPKAVKRSPFDELQVFLNGSDQASWGIVTNGLLWRIARDHHSLTQRAWIQIDFKTLFEKGYSEFAPFWLLCHASRFEPREGVCPLEQWHQKSHEEGIRARERLRDGFVRALEALGNGFISHPRNHALREELRNGTLGLQAYFEQLLRLTYRIIFLLRIEERELLHPENAHPKAKETYKKGYSVRRLSERALRIDRFDQHSDLWQGLVVVFKSLAQGQKVLALPALGGLFSKDGCPHLERSEIKNPDLLQAIFHLSWLQTPGGLVRINWRDLGAEEIGHVYESLLELLPQLSNEGRSFRFQDSSTDNARKKTGSYYTPEFLVEILLQKNLDPLIEERKRLHHDPLAQAKALLDIKILDPACGSGHFLLAAARRLAEHIAGLRSPAPSLLDYQNALREVIASCIHGVDLNPLALELCKVNLWIESAVPGKALPFLDHHLRVGNSLIGAPIVRSEESDVQLSEIPRAAWEFEFKTNQKELKSIANDIKRRNEKEAQNKNQLDLSFSTQNQKTIASNLKAIESIDDQHIEGLSEKESAFRKFQKSELYQKELLRCNTWCASFFWLSLWPEKSAEWLKENAPTTGVFLRIAKGKPIDEELRRTIESLAQSHAFFHWELAFEHIFDRGGFDLILSNPPWGEFEIREKEFLKSHLAPNEAEEIQSIEVLKSQNPKLFEVWQKTKQHIDAEIHFFRASQSFPLTSEGRLNTYALFAERILNLLSPKGRAGIILPTNILTDISRKAFREELFKTKRLVACYDFLNQQESEKGQEKSRLFQDVDQRFRISLLSLGPSSERFECIFLIRSPKEMAVPSRTLRFHPSDLGFFSPETLAFPLFSTATDLEINRKIYKKAEEGMRPWLGHGENPGATRAGPFHETNDKPIFREYKDLKDSHRLLGNAFVKENKRFLPLYQGKMIAHLNHRFNEYDHSLGKERPFTGYSDPNAFPLPRFWVEEEKVERILQKFNWKRSWLFVWRNITNPSNARTMICAFIPRVGVGNTINLLFSFAPPRLFACLAACLSSFAFDYATRQKIGGTDLSFHFFMQLPALPPEVYEEACPWGEGSVADWIVPRVLELAYTAWDLEPLARDLGDEGPPFIWDEKRREILWAELHAAFFHLYGLSQEELEHVMESFPIIKSQDMQNHGEYRTKRLVLERYKAMAEAIASKTPYRSPLGPPLRASEC